jgi:hypothetical protein
VSAVLLGRSLACETGSVHSLSCSHREAIGDPGAWRLHALRVERTPQPQLDGAAGYMRRSDSVAVTLARRMPRAMRLAGQLAARRASAA